MITHLQKQLEIASAVVENLTRRGHVVLAVVADANGSKPVIEIANTKLCRELHGTPTVEVRDDGRVEQLSVALVNECRILWRAS